MPSVRLMIHHAERFPSVVKLRMEGVPDEAIYVRVVRCRDCKRFAIDLSDHEYRSGWWCARWNTDMVKPDGFCAWGERKA